MRKNWPYFIVASFLNAVLITGAFIEFKLRGLTALDQSARAAGVPAWLNINPFLFTAGMFVVSLLAIMAIVGLKELSSKLQATGKTRETAPDSYRDVKREIRSPLQPVTWNL